MTDELTITTSLDQSISYSTEEESRFYTKVDEVITQSIETKDIELVYTFGREIIEAMHMGGLVLSRLLYLLWNNWDVYEIGDDFIDTSSYYLGISKHTIERYIKVWDMYEKEIPSTLVDIFKQKNIKAVIPIANALAQGEIIEENVWKKLADAPDYNTVSHILKEDVTGKPYRKNALRLSIDEFGSIWAFQLDNRYFVGSLEVKDEEESVRKSIVRIIKNSGIMER